MKTSRKIFLLLCTLLIAFTVFPKETQAATLKGATACNVEIKTTDGRYGTKWICKTTNGSNCVRYMVVDGVYQAGTFWGGSNSKATFSAKDKTTTGTVGAIPSASLSNSARSSFGWAAGSTPSTKTKAKGDVMQSGTYQNLKAKAPDYYTYSSLSNGSNIFICYLKEDGTAWGHDEKGKVAGYKLWSPGPLSAAALNNMNGNNDDDGSAKVIINHNSISAGETATLYYRPYTAKITYYKNNINATGGNSVTDGVNFFQNFAVRSTWASQTGYHITQWNTQANGTGATWVSGTTKSVTSGSDGSEIKLYCIWAPNTYTVKHLGSSIVGYDGNTYAPTGSVANQTHTYNGTNNISTNAYSIKGFTFGGFAYGGKTYTSGQSNVGNLTAADGATVNVVAKWSENQYSVTYAKNPNSAEVTTGASLVDGKYQYTRTHVLRTASNLGITKSGYTLLGFTTTPNGTTVNYNPGQSVSKLVTTNNGNLVLYPVWRANRYHMVYHPNYSGTDTSASTGSVDQYACYYDQTYSSYLNGSNTHFVKKGYYISYWYDDKGNKFSADPLGETRGATGVQSTFLNLETADEAYHHVYAHWEPIHYYVQFSMNDATGGTAPAGTTSKVLAVNTFDGNDGVAAQSQSIGRRSLVFDSGLVKGSTSTKTWANLYEFTYDTTSSFPINLYTRTTKYGDSKFTGWNAFGGTDYIADYEDGYTVNNLIAERNGVITLYAIFDDKPGCSATNTELTYVEGAELTALVEYVNGKSSVANSGSYIEEWLCNKASAVDREDGTLTCGTHTITSGNGKTETYTFEVLNILIKDMGSCDSPTSFQVLYHVVDTGGNEFTVAYNLYASYNAVMDIMVH